MTQIKTFFFEYSCLNNLNMGDVFVFRRWKCIAKFKTNKTTTMFSLKIPFLFTYA